MAALRNWFDIAPADALDIDLSIDLTITAPLNEEGERCPWPWDPQQLVGAPIGQYHCKYCGAMVMAGLRHVDYREDDTDPVFATRHGARFHAARTCRALVAGQMLSDYDCDGCSQHDHPVVHMVVPMSPEAAVRLGLTPCLACRPIPPEVERETFGHVPEPIYVDGPERQCAACTCRFGDVIPWPCATAVVLGLPTPA